VVDAQGIPLAHVLSAANVNDSVLFETVLNAIPPIRHGVGRPRSRPAKLHADKGYDKPHCRRYLHAHGIACRIARIGRDSSTRLGRHRCVVERTLAWLNRMRRLTIRYERRADIHEALLTLGCSLICFHHLRTAGFC
jgi:transposase